MRTGLAAATIVLIALAIFNPGMDEFKSLVQERTEIILREETGESALGRALSGAGASLAGEYVDRITDRENYFVFSTYTVDLDGSGSDEEEWKFLGIAGQFVEMDRPESME